MNNYEPFDSSFYPPNFVTFFFLFFMLVEKVTNQNLQYCDNKSCHLAQKVKAVYNFIEFQFLSCRQTVRVIAVHFLTVKCRSQSFSGLFVVLGFGKKLLLWFIFCGFIFFIFKEMKMAINEF